MRRNRSMGLLYAVLGAIMLTLVACSPAPQPSGPQAQEPAATVAGEESPTAAPTDLPATPSVSVEATTAPQPSPTAEPAAAAEPSPTLEPSATAEPGPAEPSSEGVVLLDRACTSCHSLARVESARKSREEWTVTVERMIEYGAVLDAAEQEVLINFLSATYAP